MTLESLRFIVANYVNKKKFSEKVIISAILAKKCKVLHM